MSPEPRTNSAPVISGPWIHDVEVANFRGISDATWTLRRGINCLIGAGDSRKTTLLAAIEYALWPSYALSITENDFHKHSTEQEIVITVTVANPPIQLRTDSKYLSHLLGYQNMAVHEEPTEDPADLTALRIQLRVGSDLEPVWAVIKGTHTPKSIRATDRASIGVVRIGEDLSRHVRWSRGSALMRLTSSAGETAEILRGAARSSRSESAEALSESLESVVTPITEAARRLRGIPSESSLAANADFDATPRGMGHVALHTDADIPITRSGQGTQRVVAIAAQLSSVSTAGALILDELEKGLEPHRVAQVLGTLRAALGSQNLEQVLLTTHSPRVIRELEAEELARVDGGDTPTVQPFDASLQGTIRWSADALLCKRIVICEGATEVGLVRGLIERLQQREPAHYAAAEPADAGGASRVVARANGLASMGYEIGAMYDLDKVPSDLDQLADGVERFPVAEGNATEDQLFADLTDEGVRLAIAVARNAGTLEIETLTHKLTSRSCTPQDLGFLESPRGQVTSTARAALAATAKSDHWFKQVHIAEELLGAVRDEIPCTSPYGKLFDRIETWLAAP